MYTQYLHRYPKKYPDVSREVLDVLKSESGAFCDIKKTSRFFIQSRRVFFMGNLLVNIFIININIWSDLVKLNHSNLDLITFF